MRRGGPGRRRVGGAAAILAIPLLAATAASGGAEVSRGLSSRPAAGSTETALPPRLAEVKDCSECPAMLVVPPGRFLMGSDATPRDASDRPAHQVGVGAGFAVSKLKVSSQAWKECILARLCPSPATGYVASPTQPVVSVSWIDAQQYLAWLTLRSGFEYRLLSEAEWEYVARLGERAGGEVGQQLAGWGEGLEWTSDCWHRDYIGAPPSAESWDDGGDCRLHAVRGWGPGDDRSVTRRLPVLFSTRDPAIGFRVVRSPVE